MSESKHTPGPWKTFEKSVLPMHSFNPSRDRIATIYGTYDDATMEANLLLIASAPALLKENAEIKTKLTLLDKMAETLRFIVQDDGTLTIAAGRLLFRHIDDLNTDEKLLLQAFANASGCIDEYRKLNTPPVAPEPQKEGSR